MNVKRLRCIAAIWIIMLAALLAACQQQSEDRVIRVLDQQMYGAEISADGTIIRELDFHISGKVTEDDAGSYSIDLEPVILGELTVTAEGSQTLHDRTNDKIYKVYFDTYQASVNGYTSVTVMLSKDYNFCYLAVGDHYFIGSTGPDLDPQTILQQFDYNSR